MIRPPLRGWFYLAVLGLTFTWGQCSNQEAMQDYGNLRYQEGRALELARVQPLVQRVRRLDSLIADSSCIIRFVPADTALNLERGRAQAAQAVKRGIP